MANITTEAAELASKYINMTNRPIFLTGKAGTGKTTFLREIVRSTHKNTVIAAPTGIAAINAGGVTLHSLFQLPFGCYVPDDRVLQGLTTGQINTPQRVLSNTKINTQKRKLLAEIDLLIIDEVSMLRADLLDCIDLVLRTSRKNEAPFGGIQILFIGDLLQLPPVVKDHEWRYMSPYYNSPYFFEALALKSLKLIYIEFDKIFRQTDQHFIGLLNKFRENTVDEKDLELINKHYKPDFKPAPDDGYILLTTHNNKADALNQTELNNIDSKAYSYQATVEGDFFENMYPAQEILELKKGAQVMFIKNDPSGQQRFFNGKIGKISYLDHEEIIVSFTDGTLDVEVEPYVWENIKFELNKDTHEIVESVIGSFEQYPLKLAWAITVHKSQGLTFEKAILDLSRAFAPGQMYVALSRLTSLKGLVLSTPIPVRDFREAPVLQEFSSNKKEVKTLEEELNTASLEYLALAAKKAFDFNELVSIFAQHTLSYKKDEQASPRQKYKAWSKELLAGIDQVKDIGDKFMRQLDNVANRGGENFLDILIERVGKAEEYFKEQLEVPLEKIRLHAEDVKGMKGMKKYLKELKKLSTAISFQLQNISKALLMIQHVQSGTAFTKTSLTEEVQAASPVPEIKTASRDISFEMYNNGLSIDEIAERRELSPSTIESHLTHFISTGEIEVTRLLEQEKLENILAVRESITTPGYAAILSKLGDEYSYTDVRYAMAYLKRIEGEG